MVYAKNRASVTLDGKTWRLEYQPTDQGFRYSDATNEWAGPDDLAMLREIGGSARRSPSTAGRPLPSART